MDAQDLLFALRALACRRAARRFLVAWRQRAMAIADPELRRQALASITQKAFHCEGGAVYALAALPRARGTVLRLIVALQTISDYLDNLCDRSPSGGEQDYRRLHEAFLAAIDPHRDPAVPFYAFHPHQDDSGYLPALVAECRRAVAQLPSYGAVLDGVRLLAERYTELQVRKHLDPAIRVGQVASWACTLAPGAGLFWWEAAAAAGSTLGLFALFAAATYRRLEPSLPSRLLRAYFPHIAALHILLDYFIDQEEDRLGGDMNFVAFYSSGAEAEAALIQAAARARQAAAGLSAPLFHEYVVAGLPALYLSDPKAARHRTAAKRILAAAGPRALALQRLLRR